MDGWVVAGEGPWKIIGDVKAGQPFDGLLHNGMTLRIATGAVIPEGAAGVERWEIVEEKDGFIHALTPQPGNDIRPAGDECKEGDLLASRGQLLTPSLIGLLAATGYDRLPVIRKPKIALLLLGDELQLSGIPTGGLVRDSLGPQLPGWLSRLGAEVISQNYVTDELESVIEAINKNPECDLIITTGGTADGPRDHVHGALAALDAKFIVDRIRSRPGHPTLLASLPKHNSSFLLGLPGNPQSAVVGLMTLGAPIIATFLGMTASPLDLVETIDELSAPADFTRLVLGNVVNARFSMGKHLGSAMLRGLASSSGFALAPSGQTAAGTKIRWLPLP
jgi:molybdopterin molybdotransferase